MDVWELCLPDNEQMESIARLEAILDMASMTFDEKEEETLPRPMPSSQESTFIQALQESERKCR